MNRDTGWQALLLHYNITSLISTVSCTVYIVVLQHTSQINHNEFTDEGSRRLPKHLIYITSTKWLICVARLP